MKRHYSLALCCILLSLSARGQATDPIDLNDAVHAMFYAFTRCRGQNDQRYDITNLVDGYIAAAREIERRNPGMQPPQVRQALDARLNKVKATVDAQIDSRGCEAKDIRQLVENFKAFSNHSKNGATP